MKIETNSKGAVKVMNPAVFYYHSRFNKSNKDVGLLLEFSYADKLRANYSFYYLGYSLVQPFADTKKTNGQIKKGSWGKD